MLCLVVSGVLFSGIGHWHFGGIFLGGVNNSGFGGIGHFGGVSCTG